MPRNLIKLFPMNTDSIEPSVPDGKVEMAHTNDQILRSSIPEESVNEAPSNDEMQRSSILEESAKGTHSNEEVLGSYVEESIEKAPFNEERLRSLASNLYAQVKANMQPFYDQWKDHFNPETKLYFGQFPSLSLNPAASVDRNTAESQQIFGHQGFQTDRAESFSIKKQFENDYQNLALQKERSNGQTFNPASMYFDSAEQTHSSQFPVNFSQDPVKSNTGFQNYKGYESRKKSTGRQFTEKDFLRQQREYEELSQKLKATKRQRRRYRDKSRPKKAKSAYNLFVEASIPKIKAQNPTFSAPDLVRIAAKMYNELTEEQKRPYQEKYLIDKQRFDREREVYFMQNPQMDYRAENKPTKAAQYQAPSMRAKTQQSYYQPQNPVTARYSSGFSSEMPTMPTQRTYNGSNNGYFYTS